jgi:ubiquinone/menaquinone biosynthesis C-methylase UbiE
MSADTLPPLVNAPGVAAGRAFDRIAEDYDRLFTESLIGRAQRDAVWKVCQETFRRGDHILELNCGTGEDAVFLAGRGISVYACDASQSMIASARQRSERHSPELPITFCELPSERIGELQPECKFDGAFSNFSGLNCVADLGAVASSLAELVGQHGRLVLCFSTRICFVEVLYHLAIGRWRKAFRRFKGYTEAKLGDAEFTVYYPSVRQIRRDFAPHFRITSWHGVGVAVPPSYLESWVRRHRSLFKLLVALEHLLATLPIFRSTGDHVLLCFERVTS